MDQDKYVFAQFVEFLNNDNLKIFFFLMIIFKEKTIFAK